MGAPQQPAGEEATRITEDALPPTPSLIVLTWNTWFNDTCFQQRMRAINTIIKDRCPDVIMLQEVTPTHYGILADSDWFALYTCSCQPEESPRDYFTLLCLSLHYMFHAERRVQLDNALKYLQTMAGDGAEVGFGGDLNWIEEEMGALPLPPGWVDPWLELKRGDPGYTYDGQRNRMLGGHNQYRSRMDRFCLFLRGWYPDRIEILGQSKILGAMVLDHKDIKTGKHLPITPSDHYGLLVQLRVKGADSVTAKPATERNQYFQKRSELRG